MEWGVAFVTFNPRGIIQVKIHRLSAREMLVLQNAVERGQPYSKQYISSENMFPQELATWDCIELGHGHDQPFVYQFKETRSTLCDTGTDSKNGRDEVKLRWD